VGKADCLRTRNVSGGCSVCGRPMGVAHLSLTTAGGATCSACCRHCASEPQGAIVEGKVTVIHQDGEEGRAA